MYMTTPAGTSSRLFHIFNDDHRSLCGRFMMRRRDPEQCEEIEDSTHWVKGQDCKACFRKAGKLVHEGIA